MKRRTIAMAVLLLGSLLVSSTVRADPPPERTEFYHDTLLLLLKTRDFESTLGTDGRSISEIANDDLERFFENLLLFTHDFHVDWGEFRIRIPEKLEIADRKLVSILEPHLRSENRHFRGQAEELLMSIQYRDKSDSLFASVSPYVSDESIGLIRLLIDQNPLESFEGLWYRLLKQPGVAAAEQPYRDALLLNEYLKMRLFKSTYRFPTNVEDEEILRLLQQQSECNIWWVRYFVGRIITTGNSFPLPDTIADLEFDAHPMVRKLVSRKESQSKNGGEKSANVWQALRVKQQ